MADADVVDGNAEAVVAQLAHHGCGAHEIIELGHLDHDLPRGNPCRSDGAAQRLDETCAEHVPGHDIERELEILVGLEMRLEIGQGSVEQLPCHGFDPSAGFRQRNEVHRRHYRSVLAQPAGQDLAAPDLAGPDIEDRLEIRPELTVGERSIQIGDGPLHAPGP